MVQESRFSFKKCNKLRATLALICGCLVFVVTHRCLQMNIDNDGVLARFDSLELGISYDENMLQRAGHDTA